MKWFFSILFFISFAVQGQQIMNAVGYRNSPIPEETQINHGYLYNWYAINQKKPIAPVGWHIATYSDYSTLKTSASNSSYEIIDTVLWNFYDDKLSCTNSLDLGLGNGGVRGSWSEWNIDGSFNIWGSSYYWASDSVENLGVWHVRSFELYECCGDIYLHNHFGVLEYKGVGLPVRLIKDDDINPGYVTDYDGNVYHTVKIGNQVWAKKNLAVKHYRDGSDIPNVTTNGSWLILTTGAYCAYDNDESNAFIP